MEKETQMNQYEDSIYFNSSRNCWIAQFNIRIEGQQIRRSKSGSTPEEAIERLNKIKRQIMKDKGIQQTSKVTFEGALDLMMETINGTVEDSTWIDYNFRVNTQKAHRLRKNDCMLSTAHRFKPLSPISRTETD